MLANAIQQLVRWQRCPRLGHLQNKLQPALKDKVLNQEENAEYMYISPLKLFTFYQDSFNTSLTTPGPGTYQDIHCIQKSGKYQLSKYKDSKCRFRYGHAKGRFSDKPSTIEYPGPGHYSRKSSKLKADGKYFI